MLGNKEGEGLQLFGGDVYGGEGQVPSDPGVGTLAVFRWVGGQREQVF